VLESREHRLAARRQGDEEEEARSLLGLLSGVCVLLAADERAAAKCAASTLDG